MLMGIALSDIPQSAANAYIHPTHLHVQPRRQMIGSLMVYHPRSYRAVLVPASAVVSVFGNFKAHGIFYVVLP